MWCDCGIIPIQTQLRYGKSAKSKNDRYAKLTNMPVKRTNIDFYAINFQNNIRALTHLFGNGAGAHGIGKIRGVLT